MKLSNLLIIVLLTLIGTIGNGQSLKDFNKEIRGINKAISLSDRQQNEVNAVYQKIVDDIAILATQNLSEEKFREKRRAIYSGAEFSIQQIITKEQEEKYDLYTRKVREERAQNIKKLLKRNASNQDLMDAEIGVKNIN
jgi:septal ring factor EnvC (AmiA/AmiB activator)